MSALCTHVFVIPGNMMIFRPSPGRKRLDVREKIAIALGYADLLTFDDERCRGAAGDREFPIDRLKWERDRLRPNAHQIWIALERAIEWAYLGKDDRDKVIRLTMITPRFVLVRDAELAKRCGVDRQRINFLRCELWSILERAINDPSLKNDSF
jgi:hypothetical protein